MSQGPLHIIKTGSFIKVYCTLINEHSQIVFKLERDLNDFHGCDTISQNDKTGIQI